MPLTPEQLAALDRLDVHRGVVIFDPTLGPLCVDPLREIGRADARDVVDYGHRRGWTEEQSGRINGALELFYTLTASAVMSETPYESTTSRSADEVVACDEPSSE